MMRSGAARPSLLVVLRSFEKIFPLKYHRASHPPERFSTARDPGHGPGTTVIAVLHDLNLAARFADRIVVMRKGKIACDGDAATSISADIMAQVFSVSATIRQTDHMLPFVLAQDTAVLDRG